MSDDPTTDAGDDEPPVVDLSGAVGTAGHETELLHAEGVADSAPVHEDAMRRAEREHDAVDADELVVDWATRGMDGDGGS